jgi:hypothetical protein
MLPFSRRTVIAWRFRSTSSSRRLQTSLAFHAGKRPAPSPNRAPNLSFAVFRTAITSSRVSYTCRFRIIRLLLLENSLENLHNCTVLPRPVVPAYPNEN